MVVSEVSHENCFCRFPCAPLYAGVRMERLIQLISTGPLGIFGPILVVLLCLWLGREERSLGWTKALLAGLLVLLLLIMFRYI